MTNPEPDYAWLNAKAELFISLRAGYLNIHNNFPRSNVYRYEEHRLNYRAYWVNAYNEWYVTRKICPSYGLWEEFFEGATKGAYLNENLRRALNEMLEEDFAFGALEIHEEFLKDIGCER